MTKKLFQWQRTLMDRDPIWPQSPTPVSIPPAEKNGEDRSRIFEQTGLEGLVQTGSSFGSQGHQRSLRVVLFDRIHPGPFAYHTSFWSYCVKMKLQKKKFGCYGNVP